MTETATVVEGSEVVEVLVEKAATVRKAYGQPLEKAIEFSFTYQELQPGSAIPADEDLTYEDKLSFINGRRYAAARAAEQTKAFEAAGIAKPKLLDTDEGRIATIVKALVAAGNSEDNARAMAKQLLGLN